MNNIAYYNGKTGSMEEITIPLNDRAVYFGDGVYDATSVKNGVAFALEEHMDRFYNSCRLLEIDFHIKRDELEEILKGLVAKYDKDKTGMLYWQASRGTAPRSHAYPEGVKPNLLAFVNEFKMTPFDVDYDVISMEDKRFFYCNIKTLNLIPSVFGAQRAKERGCDEIIFHRGSRVTEGAHSNVLIINNGALVSPPADELILPGITRKHLMELSSELDIPVEIRPFSMVELMNADEVIICSSGTLCARVKTVDSIPVGGKDEKTLRALQGAYGEKFRKYVGL
ncbi:MAG: aminotransferase class IV [Clostridiales bacterium]|nr:aminotransferase class IV [Clostridiales bacterium]